jgi:zinc transport system permease protein
MLEYLALPVFRRAIIALVLSGLAYPSLGSYILSLELVPARFAVMHASLLGAAIGLALGLDPSATALAAALASGIVVAWLGDKQGSASASGPLGLVMTFCLGAAFIIFHKGGIQSAQAFNLLWGSVLALRESDLYLTAATAAALLGFSLVFFKEIKAMLFDKQLAASSGMPVRPLYYALIVLACLALGMAMRLSGALLADALTILPAMAARALRKSFSKTLFWGATIGLAVNAAGFAASLAFDLPAGPAIIIAGTAAVGIASLLGGRKGKKPVFLAERD